MRIQHIAIVLILIVNVLFSVDYNNQAQEVSPYDCILIVGDSIPHGSAVFEVPGQGFPVIRTPPFAEFVDMVLHEIGAYHWGIYDLSVGASSLTGDLPYTATPQYRFALSQNCEYIVILPWLNELRGLVSDSFVSPYIALLTEFLSSFAINGQRQLILMNYYSTITSELGDRIYDSSISSTVIQRANTALGVACAPDGVIGMIGNVTCMDISTLYSSDDHIFTVIDQMTYQNNQYFVANPNDSALLDIYWQENPQGVIYGDGVHLNEVGKRILAEALVQEFLNLSDDFDQLNIGN